MSVVLNSADLAVDDRVAAIHEAICAGVLPVEIRWVTSDRQIDLRLQAGHRGPAQLQLGAILATTPCGARPVSASRTTTRGVRRGAGRRELADLPGRAADGAAPGRRDDLRDDQARTRSSTRDPPSCTTSRSRAPRSRCPSAGPRPGPRRPHRPRQQPAGAVVAPFLASLWQGDVLDRPRAAELVVGSRALELVQGPGGCARRRRRPRPRAAGPVAHAPGPALRRRPPRQPRPERADHRRRPPRVRPPALQGPGPRGIRVHRTIRRQRLEACRRELRDHRRAHVAIATISARWGFADPSHFSRVFRAAYGLTPHEWRETLGPEGSGSRRCAGRRPDPPPLPGRRAGADPAEVARRSRRAMEQERIPVGCGSRPAGRASGPAAVRIDSAPEMPFTVHGCTSLAGAPRCCTHVAAS